MKKILTLVLLLVMSSFVFGATKSEPSVSLCTDSDMTPDPTIYLIQNPFTPEIYPSYFTYGYAKGVVNGENSVIYDSCYDAVQVSEAYCSSDGTVLTHGMECPNGCKDGVCVKPAAPKCTDSDNGLNYYEKGKVTEVSSYTEWKENIFYDVCVSDVPGANLAEAICENRPDGIYGSNTYFQCPNGCRDGVCVKPAAPKCTDSDNGLNYYEKGKVTEVSSYTGWKENIFYDVCVSDVSGANLAEAICESRSDGNYGSQSYFQCPNGCRDGACVKAPVSTLAVNIETPYSGEKISGDVIVKATAKSNSDITKMALEITLDCAPEAECPVEYVPMTCMSVGSVCKAGSVCPPPTNKKECTYTWNSAGHAGQNVQFKVNAADSSGASASKSVSVYIESSVCLPEGHKGNKYSSDINCCPGLTKLLQMGRSMSMCTVPEDGSYVCANCGDGVCSYGESNCNCPSDCTSEPVVCTDSDNSPDYTINTVTMPITPEKDPAFFIAGYAKGDYVGGMGYQIIGKNNQPGVPSISPYQYTIYYDYCDTAYSVNEAFCMENGKMGAHGIACPNGCKNGACLKESTTTQLAVNIETPISGQRVSGNVNVKATAKSSSDITKMSLEITLDCAPGACPVEYAPMANCISEETTSQCKMGSVCPPPTIIMRCSYQWDSTGHQGQKVQFKVNAADSSGATTWSSVSVIVEAQACIGEGQKGNIYSALSCCSGLTQLRNSYNSGNTCIVPQDGSTVCAFCGNGVCGLGENNCNCPEDCGNIATCVGEGKSGNKFSGQYCCPGLESTPNEYPIAVDICHSSEEGSFTCTTCGNGICGLGENRCNCAQDCLATTCTDSDGGRDYYTRGQVVGGIGIGEGSNGWDYCYTPQADWSGATGETGTYLLEWYCVGAGSNQEKVKCENGCMDGACIKGARKIAANIETPSSGDTVYGIVPIKATAKSSIDISSMSLEISFSCLSGTICPAAISIPLTNCISAAQENICLEGTACPPPIQKMECKYEWDSTGHAKEKVEIMVRATDKKGQTASHSVAVLVAEKSCLGEGEKGNSLVVQACCPELTMISTTYPDGNACVGAIDGNYVCAYYDNGICGPGENSCNSPEDCLTKTCEAMGGYCKETRVCDGEACTLMEPDCDPGYMQKESTSCPSSACCIPTATCTDTDGGKDIYTTGKVIVKKGANSVYTVEDVCVSDAYLEQLGVIGTATQVNTGTRGLAIQSMPSNVKKVSPPAYGVNKYVIEQFCNENGGYSSEKYECEYGCKNGACRIEPGSCISEGETGSSMSGIKEVCCDGLAPLEVAMVDGDACAHVTDVFVCTNCGDGVCGPGENKCNCAQDCTFSTECAGEGSSIPIIPNGPQCCEGLKSISPSYLSGIGECTTMIGTQVCARCGDGVCGIGENQCNCKQDCTNGNSCGGCQYNEACLPVGTRIKIGGGPSYCGADQEFTQQVGQEESCMNNYECSSNLCVDSQCISQGLFSKILAWFQQLFGD